MSNLADRARAAPSRTGGTVEAIRDDIVTGRLAPGTRLAIGALSERYGVGATPVREALSLLSASGLVERRDQRGFRVCPVSLAEFEDLLVLRCTAEARALRQAIAHGGEQWEIAVEAALAHLARAPESGRDGPLAAEYLRRHKAFHMGLLAACGSPILLRTADTLFDESERYRCLARLVPQDRRHAIVEHGAIAEAALARDADTAVARLMTHYETTAGLLRAALADRHDRTSPCDV